MSIHPLMRETFIEGFIALLLLGFALFIPFAAFAAEYQFEEERQATNIQFNAHESSGALSTATWYHLAAAINTTSGAWNIYVNGSSVDSGTNTAPFTIETNASAFNVGFGASQGGDNYFDGLIDDARVWNAVRTSSQISSNYNCALAGSEANLQAYWKLDNNGNDSTANGNNLTNNNSATFSTDVNFTADCGGGGGGGSSSTAGISYTYDNVGNITQITDNSTIGTGKTLGRLIRDLKAINPRIELNKYAKKLMDSAPLA